MLVQHAEPDDDQKRGRYEAHRGGQRTNRPAMAIGEHDEQIEHIRPRQHLAERHQLEEFLVADPAPALDQLPARPEWRAAETGERDSRTGQKDIERAYACTL